MSSTSLLKLSIFLIALRALVISLLNHFYNLCFKFFVRQFQQLYYLVTDVSLMSSVFSHAAAAAKSLQSCPTLCDPTDGSPPGSPSLGFQARILEWVCCFLRQCMKVKSLSRVRLLATPWTAAYQAPLSMGFFRQEYWSGVPLPSPLFSRELTFSWFFICQVILYCIHFQYRVLAHLNKSVMKVSTSVLAGIQSS